MHLFVFEMDFQSGFGRLQEIYSTSHDWCRPETGEWIQTWHRLHSDWTNSKWWKRNNSIIFSQHCVESRTLGSLICNANTNSRKSANWFTLANYSRRMEVFRGFELLNALEAQRHFNFVEQKSKSNWYGKIEFWIELAFIWCSINVF